MQTCCEELPGVFLSNIHNKYSNQRQRKNIVSAAEGEVFINKMKTSPSNKFSKNLPTTEIQNHNPNEDEAVLV